MIVLIQGPRVRFSAHTPAVRRPGILPHLTILCKTSLWRFLSVGQWFPGPTCCGPQDFESCFVTRLSSMTGVVKWPLTSPKYHDKWRTKDTLLRHISLSSLHFLSQKQLRDKIKMDNIRSTAANYYDSAKSWAEDTYLSSAGENWTSYGIKGNVWACSIQLVHVLAYVVVTVSKAWQSMCWLVVKKRSRTQKMRQETRRLTKLRSPSTRL